MTLLELDHLPESLMFLGGGYIGVELTQTYFAHAPRRGQLFMQTG